MWVTLQPTSLARFEKSGDLAVPAVYSALRGWSETLIRIVDEDATSQVVPPVGLRTRSFLGRVTSGSRAAVGPVTLRVDPSMCAVADADRLDPMVSWPGWQQLLGYLVDGGHSAELVREAISPVSYDEARVPVDLGRLHRYITTQLDPGLLRDVVGFFGGVIGAYLRSWTALAAYGGPPDGWEVVVPEDAVIELQCSSDSGSAE